MYCVHVMLFFSQKPDARAPGAVNKSFTTPQKERSIRCVININNINNFYFLHDGFDLFASVFRYLECQGLSNQNGFVIILIYI